MRECKIIKYKYWTYWTKLVSLIMGEPTNA